ncbi:MAG: hypothetical protein JJU00_18925 [Opitutales bacterium]|nr:hypothetical protein [Opitutales bacterium]
MRSRTATLAAALALIAVCLWIVPDYGMGWDEPTRWRSGDRKVEYYAGFAEAESWREHIATAPKDLYPGLFDIPLALADRFLSIDRFLWGHYWSLFFGLAGLGAVWLTARRLERSNGWIPAGLCGALLLLLVPDYFGHMFINPKDIPFAAAYGWAVFGLVAFVSGFPRPTWRRTLFFGLTVGLCMATRLPGGVVIGYAALTAALWLLIQRPAYSGWAPWFRDAGALLTRGVAAGIIALATLLPWWPAAHGNPFAAPAEAVGDLHSFSATIPVFYAGRVFEAGDGPATYALWMFLISMPPWFHALLALAVVALATSWSSFVDCIRQGDARMWSLAAVALAAGFPMLYVTFAQPAIHNGFRHMLYVLPPLAVLAALGLQWAGNRWLGEPNHRVFAYGGLVLLALVAVSTLIRLHPYQYVYYNALIGGPAGSYGRYETEYWFTSTKHGLEWLSQWRQSAVAAEENAAPIRLVITGPWHVAEPFLPEGFELTGDPAKADLFMANTQMMMHTLHEGEVIHMIERMGLPILVIKDLRTGR